VSKKVFLSKRNKWVILEINLFYQRYVNFVRPIGPVLVTVLYCVVPRLASLQRFPALPLQRSTRQEGCVALVGNCVSARWQ